jgi:hypothetical protein
MKAVHGTLEPKLLLQRVLYHARDELRRTPRLVQGATPGAGGQKRALYGISAQYRRRSVLGSSKNNYLEKKI